MDGASVPDIIELWPSAEHFSADLGLKWPGYGRVMKMRGRIPRKHWPKVLVSAEQRGLPVTERILEQAHRP